MSVDQWGVIFLTALATIAVLGSLIVDAYKNGFAKKQLNYISIIIKQYPLYACGTLLFIVVIFFFVTNVEFGENGNIASFGQTGDFFGGILNPIFGFLTVFLLIHTLNLEKRIANNDELKNKILLYESLISNRLKELEEIFKTEHLFDTHNQFHDYQRHTPNPFYLRDLSPKDLKDSRRESISSMTEKIYNLEQDDRPGVKNGPITNTYDANNYNVIWRARKAIKDIRDINFELLKVANDDFYIKYQKNKYLDFIHQNSAFGLITISELHMFTQQLYKH